MWRYVQYFQKGLSHIRSNTNCQDNVSIRENERCIIAALADGLGSLQYSEIAARVSTELTCEEFLRLNPPRALFESNNYDSQLKSELLEKIKERLSNICEENQISLEEMDCTLAFVYISKIYDYAIVGRLGDSAVCVIRESSSVSINGGNRSANGTHAVLDSDAQENMELYRVHLGAEQVLGFILTSDGLENEIYLKGSSHVEKAAEKYFNSVGTDQNAEVVIKNLVGKLTTTPNSPFEDDISIAIISRSEKPLTLPEDPTWLCICGQRNRLQDTYCQHCNKDFSQLYKNIRFREYGGKAAFFININTNPEKEREILGIETRAKSEQSSVRSVESPGSANPNARFVNNAHGRSPQIVTKATDDQSQKMNQSAESCVKQLSSDDGDKQMSNRSVSQPNRKSQVIWPIITGGLLAIAFCAVVSGLILTILLSRGIRNLNSKMDQVVETTEKNTPSTSQGSNAAKSYIILPNGNKYWGETEKGVPNGIGILLEDGKYYLGRFIDGEKDGLFTIIDQKDWSVKSDVEYSKDNNPDDISSTMSNVPLESFPTESMPANEGTSEDLSENESQESSSTESEQSLPLSGN